MRIERIVLKDHGDIAFLGRNVIDDPIVNDDFSARDALKPGNHAKKRRLPAAGRSDQNDELTIGYFDRNAMQDLGRTKCFANVANFD